ncbi:Myb/SANT-like domain [Phytophthora cactorum]|nr:Myb/SANT-like domain [Phytophthora cactorum]
MEAWVAVHEQSTSSSARITIQQIKTRVQTLKSEYTTISHMQQASGSGDPNHNVVIVHDDVWERYVKEHPKAVDYRKKRFLIVMISRYQCYPVPTLPSNPSNTESRAQQDSTNANKSTTQQKGSRKRNRDSGGVMIADAISEVALEMRHRTARMKALTPSQKAVKVLQSVYAERFSAHELAQAFDVMLNESKARLFMVMEDGEVRDVWLANQLRSILKAPSRQQKVLVHVTNIVSR